MRKIHVLRIVIAFYRALRYNIHAKCFLKGCPMSRQSKTEMNIRKTEKLRGVLKTLPPFCLDFFRAIEPRTSLLTRINYAYDLRLFFTFLENERGLRPAKMAAKDLESLSMNDFELYLEYLKLYYRDNETVMENGEKGLARKLSAIRSLYKYYYKKEMIGQNITARLETPKLHEKPILRLDHEETNSLLHVVESGAGLSNRQQAFNAKTRIRDLAILTLFLTTGIRISELCALDVSDFDFRNNAFKVLRKGGNEALLFFGEEAKDALERYLEQRKSVANYSEASPMFLSLQNKRMSVRAVQMLVGKYSRISVPLKHISPHKLRSTYGTMLYQQTGDIYLVADVLGHKDVNTTRKHYAAMDEQRRKMAAQAVTLKEPQEPEK
jgi:Site-specific recombinase XerD